MSGKGEEEELVEQKLIVRWQKSGSLVRLATLSEPVLGECY